MSISADEKLGASALYLIILLPFHISVRLGFDKESASMCMTNNKNFLILTVDTFDSFETVGEER